ncbi:MAG: uridine kinase [Legionellaceae bacterium]|nr:uridine kinase [Legionellaceae bacterium]
MNNKVIIIGIAGASASGKSLLANTIVEELGSDQVAVIPEDSYYHDLSHLPKEEREKVNFDHPDALDHELLLKQLRALQDGESVEVPIYDHSEHIRLKKTRHIGGYTIVVLEGILIFADISIRNNLDIRIFMDTPLDICLIRRLKRDILERARSIESVIEQYEKTVRPMYMQFIEPSKRYADLIVPRGGKNRIAIDMIKTRIRELIGQNGKSHKETA